MNSKSDDGYALAWAKKIKAVNFMGGKCSKCGEKNIFKLEFHHINGKQTGIDSCISYLKHARWSVIEAEIKKCILVCRNCHADIHYDRCADERPGMLKLKLLEYKNIFLCEECGYSGGTGFRALDFHHKNADDKNFCVSEEVCKRKKIIDYILEEVDKCSVICRNCHSLKHFDTIRFHALKGLILKKVKCYQEDNKVDHNNVLSMYASGVKQIDIARSLFCSKGTVHWILKKYRKI